MSVGARSPTWRSKPGVRSSPRVMVMTAISEIAATASLASSRRFGRRGGTSCFGGLAGSAWDAVVIGVRRSGLRAGAAGGSAGRRDSAARGPGEGAVRGLRDEPAVGAAPGPRCQPAHDLADVARGGGAGRGHGLRDERVDLGLGELLGQVGREDRDLGLLLGGEVVAPALAEGLEGLAPRLHLARKHGGDLVVGVRPAVALLPVVDGALGHAQRVAAQRLTRPHRGRDVGLDSLSEGHRYRHLGRDARAVDGGGGPSIAITGTRRSCVGRSRPSSRSALRRPCVLLALCFLALPLHAQLLVMLTPTSLGEDAKLLDLLVEAAKSALEHLVLTHSDFCQSGIHLLGLSFSPRNRLVAQRLGCVPPARAAGAYPSPALPSTAPTRPIPSSARSSSAPLNPLTHPQIPGRYPACPSKERDARSRPASR